MPKRGKACCRNIRNRIRAAAVLLALAVSLGAGCAGSTGACAEDIPPEVLQMLIETPDGLQVPEFILIPPTGSEVEKEVFSFLTEDMEFSPAVACGIMANIAMESQFDPECLGDEGTSYGLLQWHNWRMRELQDYADAQEKDVRTVRFQMAYLKKDLEENYPELMEYLKTRENTDMGAYEAAFQFCLWYSNPRFGEFAAEARAECAYSNFYPVYGVAQEAEAAGTD